LEDSGLDEKIILRWIFKKWDKVGWGALDWTNVAQDREKWRADVHTVMNLQDA